MNSTTENQKRGVSKLPSGLPYIIDRVEQTSSGRPTVGRASQDQRRPARQARCPSMKKPRVVGAKW